MAAEYRRDESIRQISTAAFAVAIAVVGAIMMGVTSSPTVKGAALLWLPAALQLMAGVWLGPWRGFVAGAVGAQAAGVMAYGGWAPSDWIMNFFAGGFANAFLPALLFSALRIDPSFPSGSDERPSASIPLFSVFAMAIVAVAIALFQRPIFASFGFSDLGAWGYGLPLLVVALIPFLMRGNYGRLSRFSLAAAVAVLCCLISAAIGVLGAMVGGQSLTGAVTTVGIGWFLGDTVSAILGLYALASLTEWARDQGIAPILAHKGA